VIGFWRPGSSFSSIYVIKELTIGVATIVTGEPTTGLATILSCTIGVTLVGIEKNSSWIIGVGTYNRFSSRLISCDIVLPLIISS
jgi:hypothetical protein